MGEAANQLELPGSEYLAPARLTRCDELEAAAQDYLRENPVFWRVFCDEAFAMIHRGREHYGHKTIVEYLRHESARFGPDPEGFKVNNNYAATFARVFEVTYPEHRGFFRLRHRVSEHRRAKGIHPEQRKARSA